MKALVTKCICSNLTFIEMKRIMKEKNLHSIEELKSHIPVAENCRLCVSYINKMIETGQTEFGLINDALLK